MKKTERQLLNKNREWLISALKSAGDAIITTDCDGNIDFVNEESVRIFNKSHEQLIKQNIFGEMIIFDAFDQPVVLFPQNDLNQNFSLPRDAYFLDEHGKRHNISARCSFLKSEKDEFIGYIIVFREITRIVEKEKQVDRQRNKLLKTFDILPNGMISLDKTAHIIEVNQAFVKIFNLAKKPEQGSRLGNVINCVNSESKKCGETDNCINCTARKAFLKIVTTEEAINDQRVELRIKRFGRIKKVILNLNLIRLDFKDDLEYIVTLEDITSRIKYEDDLKQARESSLRLLDSLPVMVYRLNRHYQCDFVNLTFKFYLSIDEEDFLKTLKSNMSEEDFNYYKETLFSAIENESSFRLEVQLLSQQNAGRYFMGIGHPYYDEMGQYCGIVGLFLDVNDARLTEINLLNSRRKYQFLFDSLISGFSYFRGVYDECDELLDAEIIELNPALQKIFDLDKDFLIGKRLSEVQFLTESDKTNSVQYFNRILKNGQNKSLVEYYLEGMNRWIEVSIYSPEPGFIALLVTDIDSKKRTEIKLKHAMERSEAANRAKSEFLANMSHEIRTPLNGIMGMIDLTMLESLSDEQQDNLITAKECIYSLISIINDVLDFSKIEAGQMMLELQDFDLIELMETTIKTHKRHAIEKNLTLKIHYHHVFQSDLNGDANRIKQVLNNLISNAIKFTEKGMVTVVVSEEIQNENEIALNITVEDTGIGIESENYDLLFKSFSQIDGSYTRQYGGTGLGLVITQKLLNMMEGSIRFDSVPGIGSRFYISIPVKEKNQEDKPQNDEFLEMSFDNQSILLVEDDRVNQIVMEKMLASFSIRVDTARNGKEGVDKAMNKKYDLILMDVQMPVMDGMQATKQIRGSFDDIDRNINSQTPIIALTAFALEGDRTMFKNSGMDDYVSKPVERRQLFELLMRFLKSDLKNAEESGAAKIYSSEEVLLNSTLAHEIEESINEIERLYDQENYLVLEIIAHQLKEMFEKINAQELRSLTFKLELAIRKKKADDVFDMLENIKKNWEIMDSYKLKNGEADEKNFNC
ncbi:ATP-binding protein [Eubacteriaceae bacterium ES2]|nr:ATP-binding protein [Eubacteriaceae bacterium ES2]